MKEVSVRQALQYVADHPVPDTDEWIQQPVWELVARTLYDIANSPNSKVRGANTRANKARKMIFDRAVGKRSPGTPPAARSEDELEMIDLTQKVIV
jgi:hypothetical protein